MRLITTVVAIAALTGTAGATSRAKQCRQACGGFIAACAARNQDVGGLQSACKAAALKRCRKGGPAACSVPQPPVCRVPQPPPPTCGNGVIDPREQCDGTNLNGATCKSLGFTNGGTLACTASCAFNVSGCKSQAFPATGQMTCWNDTATVILCAGTGHDGETRTGAPLAYVDNGDGTVTDGNTGLGWEKQSNGDGSIHDIANTYTWGHAFSMHVAALNTAPCFAGHCDWRVPNLKELESIVNLENSAPAVSPAFDNNCTSPCTVLTCSCTQSSPYWSSSNNAVFPQDAWAVSLQDGSVPASVSKANSFVVRAVRGGS